MTTSSTAPALLALIRRTPAPGLVLLDTRVRTITNVLAEDDVAACVWAPRVGVLAYQRNSDLHLVNLEGEHRTLLTGVSIQARRRFVFSLRGDGIAVLTDDAVFVLPIADSFGPSRRIPLPPAWPAEDLAWHRGGNALVVTCRRGVDGQLLLVDLATQNVAAMPATWELLGTRTSDGRTILMRVDDEVGEEEAGALSDDGRFQGLFRIPEGLTITNYMPEPDLFLARESVEDTGDPTRLHLLTPAGLPGHPWLQELPRLSSWSFSPDGVFLTGITRDDPDDAGDLIVAAVNRATPLLRLPISSFASSDDERYDHPTTGSAFL